MINREAEHSIKVAETVRRIRRNREDWFMLTEEKLADDVFFLLKQEFSDAQMVKAGVPYQIQYIVITKAAKERLAESLREQGRDHERKAQYMKAVLQSLCNGAVVMKGPEESCPSGAVCGDPGPE